MSNVGFERALARAGITLVRAAVGDRYVLERMRRGGFALGGEQSGHIIDLRRNTTGDGPMTAVTLLGIMRAPARRCTNWCARSLSRRKCSSTCARRVTTCLTSDGSRCDRAGGSASWRGTGRMLVRPSGTEPLMRVMAEGDDRGAIEQVAGTVARHDRASAAIL